jgi:hypothetical protein
VKDAAGQLTETTIARHSQMVGVGKIIRAVYEKQVSSLSRPLVHSTTPTDRSKDVNGYHKQKRSYFMHLALYINYIIN